MNEYVIKGPQDRVNWLMVALAAQGRDNAAD